MKLKNNFNDNVRNLFTHHWYCILCGSNQMLELHHILGRISDSAFNAAPLCHECHSHIGHTQEEHKQIFSYSFPLLHRLRFRPHQDDINFLDENWDELMSPFVIDWLKSESIILNK